MKGAASLPPPVAALASELGLVVEEEAPGGEFGALFVRDRDDRPLVLKAVTGAHRAPRWQRGTDIARRLQLTGYPAPQYFGSGVSGDLVWSLQERMQGKVPQQLSASHASALLALAVLHADAAADLEPIGSEEPRLELSLAGAERLQRDRRTATVALVAERVLHRGKPSSIRTADICHGDFHHRNFLADGASVTGVFDWEGASCGDWRFDVATLAFWCTIAPHQVDTYAVDQVRDRAEDLCEPALLAYFTAALTTRLLSFYLHAHPEFIDKVLPPIAERIVPWWHQSEPVP